MGQTWLTDVLLGLHSVLNNFDLPTFENQDLRFLLKNQNFWQLWTQIPAWHNQLRLSSDCFLYMEHIVSSSLQPSILSCFIPRHSWHYLLLICITFLVPEDIAVSDAGFPAALHPHY